MNFTPEQLVTVGGILAIVALAFGATVRHFGTMVRQQGENFEKMLDNYKSQQTNPELVALLGKTLDGFDSLKAVLRGVESTQSLSIQTLIKHGETSDERFEAMQQVFSTQSAAQIQFLHELSTAFATQGNLLHTQSEQITEVKTTMEKLNDIPALLAEIRDALRSVEGKVDRLLAEGKAVKTETQEINQRVEAVETALKAQGESIPPQEVINNTTIIPPSNQETAPDA